MTYLQIGDRVVRDTKEQGYKHQIGVIVEYDIIRHRYRIQWENNRTWYKADKLIKYVDEI